MDTLFCQSCGMPLENADVMGTNADGGKNEEYCVYCFTDGAFTQDVTMDEMIALSAAHMQELFKDDPNFNAQSALDNMNSFFPQLKRWM